MAGLESRINRMETALAKVGDQVTDFRIDQDRLAQENRTFLFHLVQCADEYEADAVERIPNHDKENGFIPWYLEQPLDGGIQSDFVKSRYHLLKHWMGDCAELESDWFDIFERLAGYLPEHLRAEAFRSLYVTRQWRSKLWKMEVSQKQHVAIARLAKIIDEDGCIAEGYFAHVSDSGELREIREEEYRKGYSVFTDTQVADFHELLAGQPLPNL